jgi:hypothetical protein
MNYLEWIGYVASVIVAFSLTISSVTWFRWANLAGSMIFSAYGFMIGALPVGILNAGIAIADAYYLYRMYYKKEKFDVIDLESNDPYMLKFLDFYKNDISKFVPDFNLTSGKNSIQYLVLRNMAVAGIFIAETGDKPELNVKLDYVIPQYRDYKNGKFIYSMLHSRFARDGYKSIKAEAAGPKHADYLTKIGFIRIAEGVFTKSL